MNAIAIHPAEPPPNEKPDARLEPSHRANESEACKSEPTAENETHSAPPHKPTLSPALPLLSDRSYALRLDRIRLETAALLRHCLARTAAGEGDAHEAARCECEASALELAAACLRNAEGDGMEEGDPGPFTARRFLQTLAEDALGTALHHASGSDFPDWPGTAANLHTAAAYRLALAVLAEPQALDNPGHLRLPLAA